MIDALAQGDSMMVLSALSADEARALLPELAELLRDSVELGASIGFLLPLEQAAVDEYWRKVIDELAGGGRVLLVARLDGQVAGTAQLALELRLNSLHRAEVQKVLVHTSARRRGLGRALMAALKEEARARGRTLLVLDTRADDHAEQLYRASGYTLAGRIPGYARSPDGTLDATTVFYRQL